jgi:catechol 2,3-dioxygenase-like lactoylglutathione lyase family enzyme
VEVLSSRVLLAPTDFERSVHWYGETLGLRVYREFGADGRTTGVVFFLGGGFLELSGSGSSAGEGGTLATLWLQVHDVDAEHDRLEARGVSILRVPQTMPWGLREMWIEDPDGTRLVLVEVPPGHPLRRRRETG